MSTGIELDRLVNLALGAPEVGAVNFNVLHGVLIEIIKSLGVEKKVVEVSDNENFKGAFSLLNERKLSEEQPVEKASEKKLSYDSEKRPTAKTLNGVENRDVLAKITKLENRLNVLDELPNNVDILKRARDKKEGKTPVGDIWQFININRRLSATEEAIEKFSSLLEHVMSDLSAVQEIQNDLSNMKKSISEMEQRNEKLMERLQTLENFDNKEDMEKIKNIQNNLDSLQSQMEGLPTKKDIDSCIKWPQFESALKHGSSGFDLKTGSPTESNLEGAAPSSVVLDTIKKIGDIQELQEMMPTKADKKDVDELKNRPDVPDDIMAQINGLKSHTQDLMDWRDEMVNKIKGRNSLLPPIDGLQRKLQGIEDLDHMSKSIKEFQDNLQKLNISTRNLTEEGIKRQRLIDELHSSVENLRINKADKDMVDMEMEAKADKLALDNMISRLKFDASVGTIDKSIEEIRERLTAQEAALLDAISRLTNDVDGKLDRLEINPLKEYINKRIKANKCKHADLPITDDSAAGMAKAAIKFHCISCARPVEVQPGMNAIPLPQYPAFPPSRSNRPYTPYDMESMRQQARGHDCPEQTSTRPCGGLHTMTYTTRRVNANKPSQQQYYQQEEVEIIVPLREETIQGQDGQIYKGRTNDFNEQLPTLQQSQQTSPKNTAKPPIVVTHPQTSPRSHTPTRPRSAVIR